MIKHLSINTSLKLVSLGRFELPTTGLGILCSIHLSYRDRLLYLPIYPGLPLFNGVKYNGKYYQSRLFMSKSLFLNSYFLKYFMKCHFFSDIPTISSTSSSKDMPACSAAMGRRLVSVMPGEVFSSRT